MTEKRFWLSPIVYDGEQRFVRDNSLIGEKSMSNNEVVDLLNTLSEDNEYLEKRFKEEEWHYDHIDEDRDVWKHKCQELKKENEELKEKIDKLEGMLIDNGLM